ncbi:MAG: Nramp family divalent metal transporter [Haloechinothrix sp.]
MTGDDGVKATQQLNGTDRVDQNVRVWHAGRQEPMPIKELPEAPSSVHIVGPAMVLVALGVGLGETYMWPRLVLVFGPEIRWLFLIGVTLQAVVMLEMARYAIATGESIFFGAARVAKPLMWFFFAVAALVYIWPGHMSAGAAALEQITGIPWLISAIVGLLLIGLVFSFAKVVYNVVENLLSVLMGVLVIGSAIVAALVGTFSDLTATLAGMFSFGYLPSEVMTAAWFPIIVGSIAFAGPSGMQQMWYTLHLRDKGAGMGAHIPKIRGLTHAAEEEAMPSRGFMVDTENPDEMRKWQGWRRWVYSDAIILFWGITMLVTVVFTVLAQAAARENPDVQTLLIAGEQDAALTAMADAFSSAGGVALGIMFFGFISLVGWKGSLGIFDAFARGQADMTYFFVPGAKRFKLSHIYFGFLWGVIAFGILILLFGPADGPAQMLDILAFLSTFAMGAYCVVLLLTNNLLLPKKIRPNMVTNVIIGFGAVFYLGMLFYSLVRFGAVF